MIADVSKLPHGTKVITSKDGHDGLYRGLFFPSVMRGITFTLIGTDGLRSRAVQWPSDHPTHDKAVGGWAVCDEMIDWKATININKTTEEKIAEMSL